MGNCIDHQSGVSWADEGFWDFSDGDSPRLHFSERLNEARARARAGEEESTNSEEKGRQEGPTATTTEVKIKITKKQLQELLRQIDEKGLPIQKVLAELIGMSEPCRHDRDDNLQQHWTPALQSIPEVAE